MPVFVVFSGPELQVDEFKINAHRFQAALYYRQDVPYTAEDLSTHYNQSSPESRLKVFTTRQAAMNYTQSCLRTEFHFPITITFRLPVYEVELTNGMTFEDCDETEDNVHPHRTVLKSNNIETLISASLQYNPSYSYPPEFPIKLERTKATELQEISRKLREDLNTIHKFAALPKSDQSNIQTKVNELITLIDQPQFKYMPLSEKAIILNDTWNLLSGISGSVQCYKNRVSWCLGHPSPEMQQLGIILMVLVPICCFLATGAGAIGIGVGLGVIGLGLFAAGNRRTGIPKAVYNVADAVAPVASSLTM